MRDAEPVEVVIDPVEVVAAVSPEVDEDPEVVETADAELLELALDALEVEDAETELDVVGPPLTKNCWL